MGQTSDVADRYGNEVVNKKIRNSNVVKYHFCTHIQSTKSRRTVVSGNYSYLPIPDHSSVAET